MSLIVEYAPTVVYFGVDHAKLQAGNPDYVDYEFPGHEAAELSLQPDGAWGGVVYATRAGDRSDEVRYPTAFDAMATRLMASVPLVER